MKKVNSLKIRNHLGEVLDDLERDGEPILVSKGRKVRAVLVTWKDFETRFLDYLAQEDRRRMMSRIEGLRAHRIGETDSVEVLRELRGY